MPLMRNEQTVLGRALFVDVDLRDSDSDPHWIDLSREADSTITRNATTTDRAAKIDAGAQNMSIIGVGWSVSANGQLDVKGAAAEKIQRQMDDPGSLDWRLHVRMRRLDGATWVGWAIVSNFEVGAPRDDVATYSMSLEGQGHLVRSS